MGTERRTKTTTSGRRRTVRRKTRIKTRNLMLLVVCCFVIIYTVVDAIMGFESMKLGMIAQLDSTLTSEVFSFAKWVVVSGATITVAKTAKGQTNSDEDESEYTEGEGHG